MVLLKRFRNKFFLATVAFLLWMLFFDRNDFFTQRHRTRELNELEQSRQHFTQRIQAERIELQQLKSDPATLEKYAREKYFMKRDQEDLYIITSNSTQ